MDTLCETNLPVKCRSALDAESWATIKVTTDFLHPEADDQTIAEFAAQNGHVLFVRDEDFFEIAEQSGPGVLFLYQRRDPTPGTVVDAVDAIRTHYSDHSDIVESIPGDWV